MDHENQAIRGVRITLTSNVLMILLQTLIMAGLARLVTAEDYGLLAGSLVVVRLVQHVLTAGPERAILLLPDLGLPVLTAAFQALGWMGLAASLSLAGIAWLAIEIGWPPAFFLALAALAPLVLLSTTGVVFRAVLRRHLAFKQLSLVDIGTQLLGGGAVALVAASQGWGVYALIAGQLMTTLLQSILYGYFACRAGHAQLTGAPPRPWTLLKPLVRSSLTISSTSFLELVNGQLPVTIIGTVLGGTPLGLYNRATTLIQIPVEMIVTSVTRVRIATVSARRDDISTLLPACREVIAVVAAIVLPLCAGAAVAAPSLSRTILGTGWQDAPPAVAWVAALAGTAMLAHVFGMINEAMLRLRERFRIQLLSICLTALCLGAGSWLGGLEGALAGAAGANVLFLLLHMRLAATCLGVSPIRLLGPLLPGAIAGAGCVAGVTMTAGLMDGLAPPLQLGLNIGLCALITESIYALLFPELNNQMLRYAGLKRLKDDGL